MYVTTADFSGDARLFGLNHNNNNNTTAAATAGPAADENDAMDETDENGNEYRRESSNDSPNGTTLTPSNNLNRMLNQGAVAPSSEADGSGNDTTTNDTTHIPPHNILPTTESTFRHNIPTGGITTTALTASSLTAALERRFSTPANLGDIGMRAPNTGTTGLTTSTEGRELSLIHI